MEILSTGEKIKRARIVRGITLKELCQDKISIAKMSCIENGKAKADRELLDYIADKIDIDVNYLVEDVYEQITNNLNVIRKNLSNDKDIEEKLKDNLGYAVKYKYYNLAFELMHILFKYYIKEEQTEKIQLIVSEYYDLYQRHNTPKNTIIYFKDMARYLLSNGEYIEAISYYEKLREMLNQAAEPDNFDYEEYCIINYREAICYENIREFKKAYQVLNEIIEFVPELKNDEVKGNIYHIYTNILIKLKEPEIEEYKELAYEIEKNNPVKLAESYKDYGKYYFEVNEKDKAAEEIQLGINNFPKDNLEKYVQFLNSCTEIFVRNKEYDRAFVIAEDTLNEAITTNNNKLIEKAYYFKGIILQKLGRYKEAEKYMNFSLDLIGKSGLVEERKKRYIDMAYLYYNLGCVMESLKYFNLAFNSNKKI